jgi:hypothetical protein
MRIASRRWANQNQPVPGFGGTGAVRWWDRLCGAQWVRASLAVGLLVLAPFAGSALADETEKKTTIVVFGDSQGQGLAGGLQRVLLEEPRYRVLNRTHPGAALVHGENEWLAPLAHFTEHEQADMAVVMFGANDRLDMRDDGGNYLRFRTDEWRAVYAARVDRMLTLLTDAKLKIMWCGNPIARSATYSVYMAEAERFGAQFVSLWSAVTDDQGLFTAYGKDRDGTTQRLRTDDGIHFTAAGYELIAEKIVGLFSTAAANGR